MRRWYKCMKRTGTTSSKMCSTTRNIWRKWLGWLRWSGRAKSCSQTMTGLRTTAIRVMVCCEIMDNNIRNGTCLFILYRRFILNLNLPRTCIQSYIKLNILWSRRCCAKTDVLPEVRLLSLAPGMLIIKVYVCALLVIFCYGLGLLMTLEPCEVLLVESPRLSLQFPCSQIPTHIALRPDQCLMCVYHGTYCWYVPCL